MRERIAIIEGIRTPFCKSGGVFSEVEADDLGALIVKELMRRSDIDPSEIDEVIVGNGVQPVEAGNIARVIALKSGLPLKTPAYTVQRNCASGFEAITTGANKLLAGEASVVLAASTESMSRVPFLFTNGLREKLTEFMRAKTIGHRLQVLSGLRLSDLKPVIGLEKGLSDAVAGMNMGITAEILAREFSISREQQDVFSLKSHKKAAAAIDSGRDKDEVITLPAPPNYETIAVHDDGIRLNQSIEALAKLKPYFDRVAGTVTAGNSSQITDGAVATLLMLESTAKERGLKPLGYLSHYAYAGLDGTKMGLGPVYATHKLCQRAGIRIKDFDIVEINEAFAAQVLACLAAFESPSFAKEEFGSDQAVGTVDPDKLNVNGGAIALGHPVGASGTRLVVTALKELHRRGKQRALATLCVGGGQGGALALEVV